MNPLEATIDHFAKRAKAYLTLLSGALTAVIASGVVLPSPMDRYLSAASALVGALLVFQVPNRPSGLAADIQAAQAVMEAVKQVGAPTDAAPLAAEGQAVAPAAPADPSSPPPATV